VPGGTLRRRAPPSPRTRPGPGGCTAAWGLDPYLVTIGKSIGGGIPSGAYGLTAELPERIFADPAADVEDTGGVGGTLAGNARYRARRVPALYVINRGVLMTPFHNMALMCPATTQGDADAHTALSAAAADELLS